MSIKIWNLLNKWYIRGLLFLTKKRIQVSYLKLFFRRKVCQCFVLTDLYGDTFSSENWTSKWNGGSSSWSSRTLPICVWRWKKVNGIRNNYIYGKWAITVFESYICFFDFNRIWWFLRIALKYCLINLMSEKV